ncbi:MAG: ATP-binding protein [Myxococcota bacterium]
MQVTTGGSLVVLIYLITCAQRLHGALVVTMSAGRNAAGARQVDAPALFVVFSAWPAAVPAADAPAAGRLLLATALHHLAVVAGVLQRILFAGRFRDFLHRAELAAANARLTQLDEAKSRFFANLSHELRTPLTLMLAPVQALLESTRQPLTDQQREKLVLAQRNALRLLGLVDDLLALTRAESAAMQLTVAPLDLGQMVRALVADIEELAARKRLVLDTRVEPAPLVEADHHLVERVLLNVVGNAAKFVKEGGHITLSVREVGDGVELSVADDGIGIEARDLPRIFDRFYQADSGSTRRTGGTGIGLSLVKEIIDLHGGKVWAESQPGVGTTVHCWFPKALSAEKAKGVTRVAAVVGAGLPEWHEAIRRDKAYRLQGIDDATERRVAPRPQPRGQVPTVLVAEDNHDMIRFLVALLAYDFNVITAQNGRDALRLSLERRPDLIISDVMMPEMDGIQLVTELRASPLTRHVPFIFLTARGMDDDRLAGRQGGADIYLTKPFKSEELLAAVDTLLARQASMQSVMSSREDEVVVFMASGVSEQLEPTLAALAAVRETLAREPGQLWDAVAGGFDASLARLGNMGRGLDELARAGVAPVVLPANPESSIRAVVADVRARSATSPIASS